MLRNGTLTRMAQIDVPLKALKKQSFEYAQGQFSKRETFFQTENVTKTTNLEKRLLRFFLYSFYQSQRQKTLKRNPLGVQKYFLDCKH